MNRSSRASGALTKVLIYVMKVPEEDGAKEALEEIMAENFLFLAKGMNLQIQKADL